MVAPTLPAPITLILLIIKTPLPIGWLKRSVSIDTSISIKFDFVNIKITFYEKYPDARADSPVIIKFEQTQQKYIALFFLL
jgi:hypothetical protein